MKSQLTVNQPGRSRALRKSQLREETHFFMKISKKDFSTEIEKKDFSAVQSYNYRIVHNLTAASSRHEGQSLYVDPQFTIVPEQQFPEEKVLVKRLSNLYGITNRPNFFDLKNQRPTSLQDNEFAPNCIRELGLFDIGHYKSLFITQSFQQSGKYILVANTEGRFQVVSVDDRIPVYADTLEPVWGLTFENPWELILIKAWAKVRGGYHVIRQARPFEFIETFSQSTWKYFNLSIEAKKFLHHYYESNKFKNGKIILKTKRSQDATKHGFTADASSYELIAIHQERFGRDQNETSGHRFVLTVRSTDKAKFIGGQLSLYHPTAKEYLTEGLTLEHDTLMTDKQFLSFFSSARITSLRHEDFFSGYKILDIQKYNRKAHHLQFVIPHEGFFDFSILQFAQNKFVEVGDRSRALMEQSKYGLSSRSALGKGNRYLRTKYILVRDNACDNFTESRQSEAGKRKTPLANSKIKDIRGKQNDYTLPRFTTYEIQYFKGYSNGSAHFVKLDPGRYILRFKSENVDYDARYAINWSCSSKVDMENADITVEEETNLLHDAMVSIMHKYPHFSYDKDAKTEMMSFANSFDDIGYGFAAIKCSVNCNRSIIVEVDPARLHHQGYRLKGRYKKFSDSMKKFAVKVESGQYDSIPFKKRKDAKQFEWPSQAFNIYKKQFKVPHSL